MRIWRAVQGEGFELSKTPEPGALPLGEGFELGVWPGLKVLPQNAIRTGQQQMCAFMTPKKQG